MEKLTTKTQYANFETGEFTDQQLRTYGELIAFIEAFTWEKQREHIQIGHTNPGVLIETATPNWLKLAVYYNGKYVLYFFDRITLHSKSFAVRNDAYPFIAEYFEKGSIELAAFKKENLLFKHVAAHFVTNDFKYFVDNKRIKRFLLHTSGMNFVLLFAFFILGVVEGIRSPNPADFILLGPLLIFGGIINICLFFNYFRYMKNKMLILSKGNDHFWYGDVDDLKQYNKVNISKVTMLSSKRPQSSKDGLWSEFALYKIHFSNGEYPIAFTSLLINKADFRNKLSPAVQTEEYKAFPFFTDLDTE